MCSGQAWATPLPEPTACPASTFLGGGTNAAVGDIAYLMDVASDSSGIHVFAVGLGTSLKNPPILYSGSGGATWTMQTSPAISSSLSYDLTGVAVATGKVAFACGGDVRSTPGTGMVRSSHQLNRLLVASAPAHLAQFPLLSFPPRRMASF